MCAAANIVPVPEHLTYIHRSSNKYVQLVQHVVFLRYANHLETQNMATAIADTATIPLTWLAYNLWASSNNQRHTGRYAITELAQTMSYVLYVTYNM